MRKAKQDSSFPSHNVFNRFGGKHKLLAAVAEYCRTREGFDDVRGLCDGLRTPIDPGRKTSKRSAIQTGFVYLMRSGRHYKIGRSNSLGRREWELSIKIPVPPKTIHKIETDDPSGVETYWHKRFSDKRGEGEWFELLPEDVEAFKSWKRIV